MESPRTTTCGFPLGREAISTSSGTVSGFNTFVAEGNVVTAESTQRSSSTSRVSDVDPGCGRPEPESVRREPRLRSLFVTVESREESMGEPSQGGRAVVRTLDSRGCQVTQTAQLDY